MNQHIPENPNCDCKRCFTRWLGEYLVTDALASLALVMLFMAAAMAWIYFRF